ncbi:amidase family protein [Acidovorax sp. FG27]|uniref:amidase family protein n=1 Tax=Acidovorax sp. FG27 TaxID=3133652 RepID=UPI0030E9AE3B
MTNALLLDPLLDGTASDQAAALARGDTTALALCDAAIARIEARDGAINAVVVRDFARARAQASAADAALALGERRPLLGVPITVKESFNVAGLPTTWGFEHARGFVAQADAVAVQRLKAAGAVLLGKTNVPVALGDWQSANPIHGRTGNPHDLSRTPGGSSGGAAASLAAGFVALELGSDIGGSIRVPAHFCGVYGHKPTHGLLPGAGHDFPGFPPGAQNELAVIGPLARSTHDLELALDLLAGPIGAQARAVQVRLPPARPVQQARCLLIDSAPGVAVASDIRTRLHAVADDLQASGCTVVRGTSELLPDLAASHTTYHRLLMTYLTRGTPAGAPSMPAHEWLQLLDHRARLQAQWRRFFEEGFDALLLPAFGCTAYPHIPAMDWATATVQIDGRPELLGAQSFWQSVATLPGLPATVAPIGHGSDGLPIGMQVIGPMYEDRTPLALVRHLEALRGAAAA